MAAKRPKSMKTSQCSEYGHQSCPQTFSMGDSLGTDFYCPCECHKPRATCNRCGMTGLSWAKAPQLGFRRQRLLVSTLFQPFVVPMKILGLCPQTSDRHTCGVDVEARRWEEVEAWLFDQYDEIREQRLCLSR